MLSKSRSLFITFCLVFLAFLSFAHPVQADTPLNCGTTISASISAAGEQDSYSFTLTQQDNVNLTLHRTSGSLQPRYDLYNSSGTWIAGDQTGGSYLATERVLAAGTYRVVIRDAGSAYTGDYELRLENITTPCGTVTPLTCGQTATASLSNNMDRNYYSFTLSQQDNVNLTLHRTSGSLQPRYDLYNSSGTWIAGDQTGGSYLATERVLAAGTYRVVIRDAGSAYTGSYELRLENITTPCGTVTSLKCGMAAVGAISSNMEKNYYRFTLVQQDRVNLALHRTNGSLQMRYDLYNGSGTWITGSETGGNDLAIEQVFSAGTYTVVIRDAGAAYTGNYQLQLENITTPCSTLTCGQTADGNISVIGGQYQYSFTLNQQNEVNLTLYRTAGSLQPKMDLYNGSGTLITSNQTEGNYLAIDRVLAAGTYTIVIRDANAVLTGNYQLRLENITSPCTNTQELVCGQTIPAFISEPLERHIYTFAAQAGDVVELTATRISNDIDPLLELYEPSGNKITSTSSSSGEPAVLTQTLPSAGLYHFFVSDAGFDETGSYNINFQNNNGSCPGVEILAPNGGEFMKGGSVYTISWTNTSLTGIAAQEIRYSTDGGATFPTVVASGLSPEVHTYNWTVPDNSTAEARIRILVTDTTGMNSFDESDQNFVVFKNVPIPQGGISGYDNLNRLIHVDNEDGGMIDYTYDAVGNILTRIFTANASTINTIISDKPADLSNSSSASFSFTSTGGGIAFDCQLDGDSYAVCTSPMSYAGLTEGSHTFFVRAKDAAGNPDPSPATYTWTIDTIPPDTTITGNPVFITSSASASFSFTSTEMNSTFECRLENGPWTSCNSGNISYDNLSENPNPHTFEVRAIDYAGNPDPSPATYTWSIDATPPAPPTIDPVTSPTTNNIITLRGTKDSNSSIRVNGEQIVAANALTTWQVSYSLQLGQNTLEFTSRDAVGNVSAPVTIQVELLFANQLDPDIVGLWHMDGNWLDYSGTGNDGAPHNGATFSLDNISGTSSGIFDGLDDYVIKNPFNNFPSSAITAEFWMKSSDNVNEGVPVSYAVSSSDNEFLISNYKNYAICKSGSCVTTGISANDGNWHHIAVTWSSNGETKLYKDGVLVFPRFLGHSVKLGCHSLQLK